CRRGRSPAAGGDVGVESAREEFSSRIATASHVQWSRSPNEIGPNARNRWGPAQGPVEGVYGPSNSVVGGLSPRVWNRLPKCIRNAPDSISEVFAKPAA